MRKLFLVLLCVLALTGLGFAQGSQAAGNPVLINQVGQPLPGVTVAICSSNPGSSTPPCGSLVTTYTDITLGTACSGAAGTQPLNNAGNPSVGSGCSNPGLSDGLGNVIAYAVSGQYWCQYYGTNIVTAVLPCIFPAIPNFAAPGPIGSSVPNSGAFTTETITNSTTDAGITYSAAGGGKNSAGFTGYNVTDGNNGEWKSTITTGSPTGWIFCLTNPSCPMQINGNGNGITLTNDSDTGIMENASLSGVTTEVSMNSVISNSIAGQFQIKLVSGSPNSAAAFELVNGPAGTKPFTVNWSAPTQSLIVTQNGNTQLGGSLCFTSTQCISAGSGSPSGGCSSLSNTGSLYLNSAAADASHVLYVCQNATWSPVTVP